VDRVGNPSALVAEALARPAAGSPQGTRTPSPGSAAPAPPGPAAGEPPPLCFLFTTTETGLPALAADGGLPVGGNLPVLAVPPLDAGEARRVYDLFRQGGGAEPSRELLEALTTPLLLRLAVAALASEARRDLGAGQVLLAYAERAVFGDLPRTAIVARLAQEMLTTGARTVPVATLTNDSALAPALLADGPEAPLRALIREGILSVERLPVGNGLPLPAEPHVGFTFDYLRDFVLFTRLAGRYENDQAALRDFANKAGPAAPLIGGLRFLIQERLRGPDPGEATGRLVALLLSLPPVPQAALLHQLLSLPVAPDLPLAGLLRAVFSLLNAAGRQAFVDAAAAAFDRLDKRGQVEQAGALCRLTRELGLPAQAATVLPIVLDWSRVQLRALSAAEAAQTARTALEDAHKAGDRSLEVEALVCLEAALEAQAEKEERADVRARLEQEPLAGLSPRAEFAARLWEWLALQRQQQKRAEAGLQRAKELAAGHRARWQAEALLAELRHRMEEEKFDRSKEAADLIEEALQAAQRAGYPHLEATARLRAAWHDRRDTAREVEAGLEAAEAAGSRAARAGLLRVRAHDHILRGRFDEGARDGEEAARLFKDLHYRYRYLKTLQHITAICDWELGRPGRALASWRELLDGLAGLGKFREAALSALLVAEMACDLGKREEAARTLDQARCLAAQVGGQHGLNFDVAEGLLLGLEGRTDEAVATFERARQWGRDVRFLDFMFQPGILAARLLLERRAGDAAALEEARRILNEMLEDPSVTEENRNRYAGELYSLYGLYNLERKAPEEAGLWLEKADRWFADRPNHRAALQWRAVRLLADWVTAANLLEGSAAAAAAKGKVAVGLQQKAMGLQNKVKNGVEAQVLKPLIETARTFADFAEQEAFAENHPARRLLVGHGIPEPPPPLADRLRLARP
jgi:hypothetical protein